MRANFNLRNACSIVFLVAGCLGLLLPLAGRADQAAFHYAPPSATKLANPYSDQASAAAAGRTLYSANCASCHGANTEGTGNIPALAHGAVQKAADGEVFWFITSGAVNNGMPSWAALPEQQRWQIVTYLKTLVDAPVANAAPAAVSTTAITAPPPPAPFTDFRYEAPGNVRKITVNDLPAPFATSSAGNAATIVPRPADAWPKAPDGFKVGLYAEGLATPRVIRVAPNGDVFVAESSAGRIHVFRGMTADGKPQRSEIFASGLTRPYGIAFYPNGANPQWVYVGDTDAVVRFPYRNGDLKATGAAEHIVDLPHGSGHWTRDLRFSRDGKILFVAVGSRSNVDDPDTTPAEKNRADILAYDPDGSHLRVYASGIRNPSGLAIDPDNGQLWCTVNERDGLGDNLVPDYITSVREGGFYGWPWWYLGAHQDPRHSGKHPELKDQAIVPDVLLQPHNASLQIAFYDGKKFPKEYQGDLFASEHGSWNKSVRVGYEVIRVPRHQTGKASGEYQDFVTGFVLPNGQVWGRPVGITTAADGSLLVTDDGSNSIWRIDYVGK
ncbi:MAG: putative L-sorbosone dehydrogenase, distantly related to a bacterial beta-galactosidase [Nevskia sp.]|nr:putative L-sorbosone dehydrogenase, distantly related to a bacterial beta-galactosidase [Nevskia sp.]